MRRAFAKWVWNLLIIIDQFANVFFGPLLNAMLRPEPAFRFGDPDETLSSVMGKSVRAGQCRGCRWICRMLNKIDPDHCNKSIESDEGSRAL